MTAIGLPLKDSNLRSSDPESGTHTGSHRTDSAQSRTEQPRRGPEASTISSTPNKWCSKCHTIKAASEFQRGKQRCKACIYEYVREWGKRNGGESWRRAAAKCAARYPERIKARKILNQALLSGRITQGPCEVGANCRGRIEGHHDDYSKPLDARWFCRRHHHAHHGNHLRGAAKRGAA